MTRRVFLSSTVGFLCLLCMGQTQKGALHLFPNEVRTMAPSVVYDFLERYLYEVSLSKRGYDFYRKMADEHVIIREGSLDNISLLSSVTPFSLTRYEDKGYEICWTDTMKRVLLCMQFPIQFELLLGKKKDELEKAFKDELLSYSKAYSPDKNDVALKPIEGLDNMYGPTPIAHYYVKSLNTATYYREKDKVMSPIYSSDDRRHSAANLFHGVIDSCLNYMLHVEQTLYGFQKQSFIVGLSSWLNYCKENHLTIYFGIEEERRDGLKALLIAHNQDLGYNHMLSIILPDDFVERQNAVLKVIANTYIRTDNVEELYDEKNKKGKKL